MLLVATIITVFDFDLLAQFWLDSGELEEKSAEKSIVTTNKDSRKRSVAKIKIKITKKTWC